MFLFTLLTFLIVLVVKDDAWHGASSSPIRFVGAVEIASQQPLGRKTPAKPPAVSTAEDTEDEDEDDAIDRKKERKRREAEEEEEKQKKKAKKRKGNKKKKRRSKKAKEEAMAESASHSIPMPEMPRMSAEHPIGEEENDAARERREAAERRRRRLQESEDLLRGGGGDATRPSSSSIDPIDDVDPISGMPRGAAHHRAHPSDFAHPSAPPSVPSDMGLGDHSQHMERMNRDMEERRRQMERDHDEHMRRHRDDMDRRDKEMRDRMRRDRDQERQHRDDDDDDHGGSDDGEDHRAFDRSEERRRKNRNSDGGGGGNSKSFSGSQSFRTDEKGNRIPLSDEEVAKMRGGGGAGASGSHGVDDGHRGPRHPPGPRGPIGPRPPGSAPSDGTIPIDDSHDIPLGNGRNLKDILAEVNERIRQVMERTRIHTEQFHSDGYMDRFRNPGAGFNADRPSSTNPENQEGATPGAAAQAQAPTGDAADALNMPPVQESVDVPLTTSEKQAEVKNMEEAAAAAAATSNEAEPGSAAPDPAQANLPTAGAGSVDEVVSEDVPGST